RDDPPLARRPADLPGSTRRLPPDGGAADAARGTGARLEGRRSRQKGESPHHGEDESPDGLARRPEGVDVVTFLVDTLALAFAVISGRGIAQCRRRGDPRTSAEAGAGMDRRGDRADPRHRWRAPGRQPHVVPRSALSGLRGPPPGSAGALPGHGRVVPAALV